MAKNSVEAYGAKGKTNVLKFAPESLYLEKNPTHPLYDERVHLPLEEWMVQNIMHQGVIEPIVIWKDKETGVVYVVDGRQRVKHALEANVRLEREGKKPIMVSAVVRTGSVHRAKEAAISANEIFIPDTPLGRAKKMTSMLEIGYDKEDLSLFFGCTPQTVAETLALLECTQAVQTALEAGEINTGHARQLSQLSPDEQRGKVEQLIQAAAGVKGHERSRRQRQVISGDVKPRMKTRKQIEEALKKAEGDYAAALRWVLGSDNAQDER